MDADYLSAVERGDMATAQQMVMEAAKLAMPNTKVVDENGNALVGYYGDRMKARCKLSADIFFTLHSNYARLYIIAWAMCILPAWISRILLIIPVYGY